MASRWMEWYFKNHEANKAKKAAQMVQWRAANREKSRDQSRQSKAKLRVRLFEMYGNACALCGFANKVALTLDHVTGNGNQERREFGERGVYIRALALHRPDEYRTLCMNCQFVERERMRVAATAFHRLTALR